MIQNPEEDLTFLSDGNYDEGSTSMHDAVSCVVMRLPEAVQDFLKDNVVFYAQSGANAVAGSLRIDCRWAGKKYVPKDFDEKHPSFEVRIVLLHESLERESLGVQDFVVAHEIAHQWLSHGAFAHGATQHERNEAEANRQANEWGFIDPRPQA